MRLLWGAVRLAVFCSAWWSWAMSWKATAYTKDLRVGVGGEKITRSEKLLLFIIADYYNDEQGEAWPSVKALAEDAIMSQQLVKQVRQSLVRKGVLTVRQVLKEDGSFAPSRYSFADLDTRRKLTHPPVGNPCKEPPVNRHRTANAHPRKASLRSKTTLTERQFLQQFPHSNPEWDFREPLDPPERWLMKELLGRYGLKVLAKAWERTGGYFHLWRNALDAARDRSDTLKDALNWAEAEMERQRQESADRDASYRQDPEQAAWKAQNIARMIAEREAAEARTGLAMPPILVETK